MTTENDIDIDIRQRIEQFFSAPSNSVDVELFGQRLEETAGSISSAMAAFVTLPCDVKLDRIDEANENGLSAEEPIAVAIVTTTRFADNLIVTIPHASVLSLVGLMYGEPEDVAPVKLNRDLTELELHIVQDISKSLAEALLGELAGPVQSIECLTMELGLSDETDPAQQAVEIDTDKKFAFFELSFGIREPIPLHIGFPASTLQQLNELLIESEQSRETSPEEAPNPEWSTKIKSKIDDTQIEVVACIVCPDATLAAIAALKPGHIVEIYQTNNSLVTLECDNEPIYRGSLGKVNGRLAVEVEAGVDHWNEFLCEMLFEADQSRDS